MSRFPAPLFRGAGNRASFDGGLLAEPPGMGRAGEAGVWTRRPQPVRAIRYRKTFGIHTVPSPR